MGIHLARHDCVRNWTGVPLQLDLATLGDNKPNSAILPNTRPDSVWMLRYTSPPAPLPSYCTPFPTPPPNSIAPILWPARRPLPPKAIEQASQKRARALAPPL